MSRIILQNYDNGGQQFVVGWDVPLNTFFWQEFNKEPGEPYPMPSGCWRVPGFDKHFPTREKAEAARWEGWEEMRGYAGYDYSEIPTLDDFLAVIPDKIDTFINDTVKRLLLDHQEDPDAGRIVVDLTTTGA